VTSDEYQVTTNGLLVTRHWPLTTGGGPENRTLPCTLIRGKYRLIRPARTPVLTTLEARLGIEPRLSALQADAFPLGYRALQGARIKRPLIRLRPSATFSPREKDKAFFPSPKGEGGPQGGR
jgi:hypothetical protein